MQEFHQDDFQEKEECSDEIFMQAVANGAVWAIDSLYQRYSFILYTLVYRMVADHQMTVEQTLREPYNSSGKSTYIASSSILTVYTYKSCRAGPRKTFPVRISNSAKCQGHQSSHNF